MSTTYKAVDKALEVPPRPQVVLIAAKVSELMGTAGVNPLHALTAPIEKKQQQGARHTSVYKQVGSAGGEGGSAVVQKQDLENALTAVGPPQGQQGKGKALSVTGAGTKAPVAAPQEAEYLWSCGL
jgi:hypothetical protein